MTLLLTIFLSFLAVRGFRFTITVNGFTPVNTESFLWLILFVFFIWSFFDSFKNKDKKLKIYSILFGVIVAVFYVIGICFEKKETMAWIWTSRSNLINYLNLFFSYAVLYYFFAYYSFRFLKFNTERNSCYYQKPFSIKTVFIIWILLLLCYLPWYLYYYPGVMTDDSNGMVFDAISLDSLDNHKSVFFTLLLRSILVPIRDLTGSLQIGIGIFILLQMLVMTFLYALAIERIFHYIDHLLLKGLVLFWFAFYPVNTNYCMILWNDILFSGCFLGLLLCVDHAIENKDDFFQNNTHQVLFVVLCILLSLIRHNGLAISIFIFIAFLIVFGKYRKCILKLIGIFLMFFGCWRLIIFPVLNVSNVAPSLILSVPLQQIARTLSLHHDELPEDELSEIEAYFNISEIWNEYRAIISDYVKVHFRNDYFSQDPFHFFALWIKLGIRYPVEYIEAFFHNNYGYWFPETTYWISYSGMLVSESVEDVHTSPIIENELLDKIYAWYAYRDYEKTPLLPLLFSRGACFWCWLFCGCYCLYNNRKKFILFIPGFALWTGILISPVYNEYRYVYGLFLGLPLVMASSLTVSRRKD